MAHSTDPHAATHVEHTGHGGHHVLSVATLLRTIGALVALTVLTVGLALAERAGVIPLGGLSVPVALAIAGTKAALVAMFFMGLKYDHSSNRIAFVGSLVFLTIFLAFTYFDTGFRDTFDPMSAVPADVITAEEAALMQRDSLIQEAITPQSLVNAPDTLLLPGAQAEPGGASQSAPVPGTASAGPATPDARGAGAAAPPTPTEGAAPPTGVPSN